MTLTNPGAQSWPAGGSGIPAVDGLLLTTASEVLQGSYAREVYMRGSFVEQQLAGYVATQEEYIGDVGVGEWSEGRFPFSGDAQDTGVSNPSEGGWYVKLDPKYYFVEVKLSRQRLLKATHATQRTLQTVANMGQAAADSEEVRMLLTTIQTASMADPNYALQYDGTTSLGASLTKTQAATYSKFPSAATYGPVGVYFDANLGTTGNSVELMLRRMEEYFFVHLGVQPGRVKCQMRSSLMNRWIGAAGKQTSVTATDVQDVTKALDRDFGGTGNIGKPTIEEYFNIKIQRNRFLTKLGDRAKNVLNRGSATVSTGTNAAKYIPATGLYAQTVAGIAGHQIAGSNTPIFDNGLGGSNGNIASTVDMVKWLNNICAVFYVEQGTCKKNTLENIPMVIEDDRKTLTRWLNMAWLDGMGPYNPRYAVYATTGVSVGIEDTNI